MPTAIPELITQEIVGRLQLITTANGYNFDVAAVERPNRDGSNLSYKHRSVQVVQGEAERVPDLDCPGNPPAIAYRVAIQLQCVCRDEKDEIDAFVTATNDVAAAVVKAVTNDGTTWYTMNGNAIDADIGNITQFSLSEGEVNGVVVPVSVLYRVAENDPYTVRM